jgi:predicted alpha/beta superfamily hydrolase
MRARRFNVRSYVFALPGWLALGAAASAQVASSPFPPVSVSGTELRSLKSASTGRNYDIQVLLPTDYSKNASARYPVLYVLDGQWDFKLLASVEGGLLYDKFVPEMIVVGITYPGVDPDYNALRAMDLTPAASPSNPGSGDGPKFLGFIERELIPFIGANYRADPAQRVLLGNSLGGLFTIYTMLARPGLFTGYVASSPAVTYADRNLFSLEREFAKNHKSINARLFIGVGSIEPLAPPVKEFISVLNSRNYSGLQMETRVIEGERHSGNKPETYNRGLRYVFGGTP